VIEPVMGSGVVNIQDLIDDANCYRKVRELRWPEGVRTRVIIYRRRAILYCKGIEGSVKEAEPRGDGV